MQHSVHPHHPTCYRITHSYRQSHSSTKPDFNDVKVAYQSKTTRELLRAFFVYQLFSFDRLVDSSEKVLHYNILLSLIPVLPASETCKTGFW